MLTRIGNLGKRILVALVRITAQRIDDAGASYLSASRTRRPFAERPMLPRTWASRTSRRTQRQSLRVETARSVRTRKADDT